MSAAPLSIGQVNGHTSTAQAASIPGNLPAPLAKVVEQACRVYCVRDLAEQAAIFNSVYAPEVEFQDNIAHSKGLHGMRMQFFSLIRLFDSVSVQPHSATLKDMPGAKIVEVEVPTTQTYGFARTGFMTKRLLPEKIVLDTTMTLTVDKETNQIVKHTDFWKDKFLPPRFVRRINAMNSNGFMSLLGWGRKVDKAAKQAPSTAH
ncbi:hypothetical protein WJX72_008471 [[Myrmecia] bisecta]|uniref:SnoaL-like domain-containing protein n=1 Tax=[Myrmecia] bisecta TaxID=41462 RepID=A0AAW1PWT3_9CHLO